MKSLKRLVFTIAVAGVSGATALAGVPQRIPYQGMLTDAAGDPVADGGHLVKFIIYDAPAGGTALWDAGFQAVTTVNGLFSYELGSNVALPDNLFTDTARYLGITVGADPELAPRVKLNTQAYAYQALRSDTAGFATNAANADLLDGLNSTDFASSAHNHDADYVNESGDVMSGPLGFINDSTPMTYVYQSGTSNPSRAIAAHSPGFPDWGIMYQDIQDEIVFTGGFDTNLVVELNGSGDNTIRLDNDAINADEMLNEPGLVSNSSASSVSLNNTSMTDIITVTITIPTSGYILLHGKCYALLSGVTSPNHADFQIDETSGGTTISTYVTRVGNAAYVSTGSHRWSVYCQRVYFKSAGTYTFRLEGRKSASGSNNAAAWRPQLTAVFLPTSYGTVQTVTTSPEGFSDPVPVKSAGEEFDEPQTLYQVDLRDLEIRARKAREAALKAELELQRAQQRQTAGGQ